MKFLVFIKEVAKPEENFEIKNRRILPQFLDYQLNEWDEFALEEAVRIGEQTERDIEVVTATIGPPRTDEVIRVALARGANRALRVWDNALEDQTFLDPNVRVQILAEIIHREQPLITFTGVMASDDMLGSTGVALAEYCGYEWAAVVRGVTWDPESRRVRVVRELEEGVDEHTELELPAVLSIQSGINEPRYASMRGIRRAEKEDIPVVDLKQLGIDTDRLRSRLRLEKLENPQPDSNTRYIEGTPEEMAIELGKFLQETGVVS